MSDNLSKLNQVNSLTNLVNQFNNTNKIEEIESEEELLVCSDFLNRKDDYFKLAETLYDFRFDLDNIQKRLFSSYEFSLKSIQGTIDGKFESNGQSNGSVAGIVPSSAVNFSKGNFKSDVDLDEIEKVIELNSLPSTENNLSDVINLYVDQINNILGSYVSNDDAEIKTSKLGIYINLFNNSIEDLESSTSISDLNSGVTNLLEGLNYLRMNLFKESSSSDYYKKNGTFVQKDNILDRAEYKVGLVSEKINNYTDYINKSTEKNSFLSNLRNYLFK